MNHSFTTLPSSVPPQLPSGPEPPGSVDQDRRAVADRAVVHHHSSPGVYRVHQSQLLRSAPTTRFPAPPVDVSGASAPSMPQRSEEHTSELQSLMRISYAVFCLKKKKKN